MIPWLLASVLFAQGVAQEDESEEIRILLAVGHAPLRVTASALTLAPGEGSPVAVGLQAAVKCKGDAVQVDQKLYEDSVVFSAGSPIAVAGRKLRGAIEISCSGDRWTAINVLPLETYLGAVLGGEMPPTFPLEALKAQAVAARSYALMRKVDARQQGKAYHLNATVLSQVYAGLSSEDPRTVAAVEATRGEILAEGVTPVEAYFHASCGGETESGIAALGRNLDYLKSVDCPCKGHSPYAHWRVDISAATLGSAVGIGKATEVEIISRTGSGRAARLAVRGPNGERKTVTAVDLRAELGYSRLPSTWFDVKREGDNFVFEGRGSGHGAGLCQWGARLLAEQGEGYRKILSHYYPGTQVERIDESIDLWSLGARGFA